MEIRDHLLIYEGANRDSRAKEGVEWIINKKYEKFISKRIGETKEFLV